MSQPKRQASREKPVFDPNQELDDLLDTPHTKVSLGFLGYPNTSGPDVVTEPPIMPPITSVDDVKTVGVISSGGAPGKQKIWKCGRVQDGHSHVEQMVYQALRERGELQTDGSRRVRIGLSALASACCVSVRRIGLVVRRLILKKTLQVLTPEISAKSQSRSYVVRTEEQILTDRRAQGLEWVMRRRGVEFVDPGTGLPIFSAEDLEEIPVPVAISSGVASMTAVPSRLDPS
ncbi:MAG: hypothetical protein EXQ52_00340 [Bryobacterales bacterium]|nr:hypothetical protein [Bryobacterales bacterium]